MTNWTPRCSRCSRIVKPVKTLSVADYKEKRGLPPAVYVGRAWHCGVCLKGEFEERVALIMEGCALSETSAKVEAKRQFAKTLGNKVWSQESLGLR